MKYKKPQKPKQNKNPLFEDLAEDFKLQPVNLKRLAFLAEESRLELAYIKTNIYLLSRSLVASVLLAGGVPAQEAVNKAKDIVKALDPVAESFNNNDGK